MAVVEGFYSVLYLKAETNTNYWSWAPEILEKRWTVSEAKLLLIIERS
jgi:hypothetical protein